MHYTTYYNSLIGRLVLTSDGENLTGVWLREQDYLEEVKKREAKK